MPEFFNVLPPDEARKLLLENLTTTPNQETIPTAEALGRVTAQTISSPQALPNFRRSTMDGYAIRAENTFGASESLPAVVTVVGEVEMGKVTNIKLMPYEVVAIHTGGMIPEIANAVVQIEHTQKINSIGSTVYPYELEILKSVSVGQNVLQIGEDVRDQEEILPAGHYLRPQDLGGLLALGIIEIPVTTRPKVGIIATGDEVVKPSEKPEPGQIRDINSYTIAGQTQQAGGLPVIMGIVPDDFNVLKEKALEALNQYDMIVMSAGSSVSARDMTVQVIDKLGQPGVLVHGVATRPGKPTIVGIAQGKPVLGLPGNPVSAMVQFTMFGVPAIYRLQGLQSPLRRGIVWATLGENIASESGREDYIPVKLVDTEDGIMAWPVFGKSNLIYTLVKADGLLKVPLNKAGLERDDWVEIQLF